MTVFRFPTRSARRVGTFVFAAALVASAAAPSAWSTAGPAASRAHLSQADEDDGDDAVPRRWLHSSDGVKGDIAAPSPDFLRGRPRRTRIRAYRPIRGMKVTQWNERTRRGPVRLQLVTINMQARNLRIRYAKAGPVQSRAPLRRIMGRRAVAAINGDFFDISSTGAPLGFGVRGRALFDARKRGWNRGLFQAPKGRWKIGELQMKGQIKQHPRWPVTNFNSHRVRPGSIGIYTPRWGRTSGYRVTGGQRNNVRQVVVRKGRVVQTRKKLSSGTRFRGRMLIGRGPGAQKLRQLRKGDRLTVRARAADGPRQAITGNVFLIRDGVMKAIDDKEMHPRTAVGIDRDARRMLWLVVDGRQSFSRGYTMVELARAMRRLGADEALNLDGGGSSTMIALKRSGYRGVINQPSDGRQRAIPNGIQVIRRR